MFRSRTKTFRSGNRRPLRSVKEDDGNDSEDQSIDPMKERVIPALSNRNAGEKDENMEDEEPPSALMMALKRRKEEKKKKGKRKSKGSGLVVRSFDVDEDDNDDQDAKMKRKKTKKRKKGGLGFGGIVLEEEEDGSADAATLGGRSAYGKEALEQLKSEQTRQSLSSQTITEKAPEPSSQKEFPNESERSREESFIPLNGSLEEGAIPSLYEGEEVSKNMPTMSFTEDKTGNNPSVEDSNGWEQQIEKRAGIPAVSRSPPSHDHKLLSLEDLSKNLSSTIDTLSHQTEDLQNATNRRRVDREHALADATKQQDIIEETGRACEFYQRTRRDLTLWVGALRELHAKLEPIGQSYMEMYRTQAEEFSREFISLQDDCVAILHQEKRLETVLGRQPENTSLWDVRVVVDEFGRDVKSQYIRDRDQRFRKRKAKLQTIVKDTAGSGTSEMQFDSIFAREDHNEAERSKVLQSALETALGDVDQNYTSHTELKSIFDGWFRTRFEDYQQCFATLSFGDLNAILLRIKLFQSSFFSKLLSARQLETKDVESSLYLDVDECFVELVEKDDAAPVEGIPDTHKIQAENHSRLARSVEKGLLPILLDILKDTPAGIFHSCEKSLLLARFVDGIVVRHLKAPSNMDTGTDRVTILAGDLCDLGQKVRLAISSAVLTALENFAIPILTKAEGGGRTDDDSVSSALNYASIHQIKILRQTLCNIILHWFPLLSLDEEEDAITASIPPSQGNENGIQIVLNFINDKYLLLLSSLDSSSDLTDDVQIESSGKGYFQPVWEALQNDSRNIVEAPSLMLLTMPLRAAAHAYKLN